MIDAFAKDYLHGDLRDVRAAMLWKLDGLAEYDVRRPLTATGTNLLGLIKHLTSTEARYFGDVFGRPFPERLPWWGDDDYEPFARPVGDAGRVSRRDRRPLPTRLGPLGCDDRRPRHRRARPRAVVAAPGRAAVQRHGPRAHRDQPPRRARRHPARAAGRSRGHGQRRTPSCRASMRRSGRTATPPSSRRPRRPASQIKPKPESDRRPPRRTQESGPITSLATAHTLDQPMGPSKS